MTIRTSIDNKRTYLQVDGVDKFYVDDTGGVFKADGTPLLSADDVVGAGKIIERGSNANGEYVKFADGTMICTTDTVLTSQSSTSYEVAWTYPSTFVVSPVVTHQTRDTHTLAGDARTALPDVSNRSSSAVRLRLLSNGRFTGSPETLSTSASAIGRWK